MEDIKNFFSKKCNTCFFKQEGECVLYKTMHYPCGMRAKKIKGIADIGFYINLVNNAKLSVRALYFSIISLVVALLVLLVNIVRLVN